MNGDGVFNIYKPAGMTSFQCANKVRKITGAKKAGHAGTLDPNAEGVLPVCVNKGTRCMDFFLDMGKSYRGTMAFGSATDTMDAWGTVTKTKEGFTVTEEEFVKVLESFKGETEQLPPQFSAVKKDGVPLYKLARQGVFTELEKRKIAIYDIKEEKFDGKTAQIYVKCSKGTYIRTLINDIGEKLGCLAYMTSLTRLSYGFLESKDALTLEDLQKAKDDGTLEEKLIPIDLITSRYPKIELTKQEYRDFKDGKEVAVQKDRAILSETCDMSAANLYLEGELKAVAKAQSRGQKIAFKPWKFFGEGPEEKEMKVFRSNEEFKYEGQTAIGLGNFDGVHEGHSSLIKRLVSEAEDAKIPSMIYTFKTHPARVLQKTNEMKLIMTEEQKLSCFEKKGVDMVYLEDFTPKYASQSPEEFIEQILVEKLHGKIIVVGSDYTFGKNRAGTPEKLKEYAEKTGHFKVCVVDLVKIDGIVVSSTEIRKVIARGDMEKYERYTGRKYSLSGKVTMGREIGRTIGFPTANIIPDASLALPPAGVYCTFSKVNGRKYKSITNIGTNPTFGETRLTVETHLLDFDGDLYGKNIEVTFCRMIRGEIKFETSEELKKQIQHDIGTARRM